MKKVLLGAAVVLSMGLTSCSHRLVDFTVISTKNAEIGANKSQGKQTEGKKGYFLGLGFNLKDAIDNALENAGQEYDLLVDGVVTYVNYPFVQVVKVKGIAVSSSKLRSQLGEDGYENWKKEHNILTNTENDLGSN